ncbi:MAG TPA: Rrf2 family transcriptional regulator [Burkholderiales bacterium]
MPTSSRFAVAVHILSALALHRGRPVTSDMLAKSASTNPAVIRRILSMLNDAGLTRAQLGQGGGALLARPAESILLLDVFRAVEREELFALHRSAPNPDCPVGRSIQPVLNRTLQRAQHALEAELAGVSLADIARDVERHNRTHHRAHARRRA